MIGARRLTRLPSVLTIAGGVLLAVGAVTPWVTLYGGLHGYSGISGLWGKLLFAAGIAALALAAIAAVSRSSVPGMLVVALGVATGALAATRLHHARELVGSGDTLMLVPSLGPGLALVLLGSLVVACGGWGTVRGHGS